MPRTVQQQETTFRSVIQRTGKRPDGSDFTYDVHYGPYSRKGDAKGVLTTELKWARHYNKDIEITGWVEQTANVWEKVEENDG